MPKLLIDGTALSKNPKGVGRYSFELINQLSRRLSRDWSINVVVFDDDLPRFDQVSRLSFIRVPRVPDLMKGLIAFPCLIVINRTDKVLFPMEAAALTAGRPTLAVLHDIDALIMSAARQRLGVLSRLMNGVQQYFRVRMLQRAEAVICNSKFTAEAAVRCYRVNREKISVGYCGVDARFYCSDDTHVQDWCDSVGHWHGYVLTFATGDPRERYDLCPAIWRNVRTELPQIGLLIAGIDCDQDYVIDLRNKFSEHGLIEERDYTFAGFIRDDDLGKLRSLYREADFYLELSGHEGFGMQLAEAMATGTTCISSGRGALSEVGGAYTVNLGELEPKAISETIVRAYRQQLQLRDNSSQVEYTKRFSWDAVGVLAVRKLTE